MLAYLADMKNFSVFIVCLLLLSCNPPEKDADNIIENAIAFQGAEAYDTLKVAYTFRDKNYSLEHSHGNFSYKRIFTDSSEHKIVDVLNNEGFYREINGVKANLSSKDSAAYANSVNSVHYFALLPYGLDGTAVLSEKLENTIINEQEYFTIRVSFDQQGGGTDFEDEFIYWFNTENFALDFMAYSYHTEGGGVRFREAYNPRKIKGVIFQDYNNYKADKDARLNSLPELYEAGKLKLLSKIELNFSTEN